jgi:hypothetical protein
MVAVEVGDKDPPNPTQLEVGPQDLVLGRFAAVEQPEVSALGERQRNAGDVASQGWRASAGAEKGELQLEDPSGRVW